MNNKKIIILGIIGCGGRIGKIHTNNVLSNFPDIKVKSVCDINIDKIKDWVYSLGIKNIFIDNLLTYHRHFLPKFFIICFILLCYTTC